MTQILIKGESVYQCDTCNRKQRVTTARDGIDVVQRCTITFGCKGKMLRVKDMKEINTTPAFPEEIPGVRDWFQRRVVYTHNQPIRTKMWTVKHNLQNKPIVYAYITQQTEASATRSSTNVPTGSIWYKSDSGYDPANPLNPTAAGLYEFNGTRWVRPKNTIPVGIVGNNIFEYMVLTTPANIVTVDANTTEVYFDTPNSGLVQCVALASQNTVNPIKEHVVDTSTPFKLSKDGEITIATAWPSPFITVAVNFKSSVVPGGVNVTFNNVDNTASVASPWVGVDKIFVNGKTYTVRSFNLASTPPVPGIMASGNVDPSKALFTFENFSNDIGENLILMGNSPYSTVDRIYDKFIDIATLSKFAPEIYYSGGEIYIEQSKIQSVYPWVQTLESRGGVVTQDTTTGDVINSHWISVLGGTSVDNSYSIATDSVGNAYIVGYTSATASQLQAGEIVAKYTTAGTVAAQWHIANTAGDYKRGIAVDSTNNVYVVGVTDAQSTNICLVKYSDAGVIQWQRSIGGTSADHGYNIAIDSGGNVYIVGSTQSQGAGGFDLVLIKFNPAGQVQWQRALGGANTEHGYGIAVDSSNNVFVTGFSASTGAGGGDVIVAKYNNSGTLLWQRAVGGINADYGWGLAADSTGNVYIVGDTTSIGAGSNDVLIVKYNTTGTPVWQRALGGVAAEAGYNITVDTSNNVYITGQTSSQSSGLNDIFIIKFNSAGTVMWQRALGDSSSSVNDRGNGVTVDRFGNLYVVGQTQSTMGAGQYDILVAKLSTDGSGIGVYGQFVYQAINLTQTTINLTQTTSSLTQTPISLTVSQTTLSQTQTNLTSSLIPLP